MTVNLTTSSAAESGRRIVRLGGDLDIATAPAAREALADEFDVVDFSELDFIDSSGMGVLLQACMGRPSRPVARGLHGQVRRILEMTGLSEMFEIDDTQLSDSEPLSS